jgi:hypothetical protein
MRVWRRVRPKVHVDKFGRWWVLHRIDTSGTELGPGDLALAGSQVVGVAKSLWPNEEAHRGGVAQHGRRQTGGDEDRSEVQDRHEVHEEEVLSQLFVVAASRRYFASLP